MRRLLLRSTLSFALAWTAACADDIPEVVTSGSSSGEDSTTGPGPVSVDTTRGEDTTRGSEDTASSSSSSEPDGTSSSSSGPGESSSSSGSSSSGGPVCGDDQAEAGEACDGTDLAGEDCASQGFDEGTLACMRDCSGFDTSGCTMISCGNDLIEGMEACDGTDLAGEDCLSQGFDGGTLACAADCSALDTSGCTLISCGNDVIEGMEACDGTDLAGQTCISQGFDAGTLGCAADCTAYDTSSCVVITCGDDVIDGNDVCDGTDLGGQTCVSQGFDAGTLACAADCTAYDTSGCIMFACGNDVIEGTEVCDGTDLAGSTCAAQGFDGGTLACAADCAAYDTAGCYLCGDGTAAGPEACDGADLQGSSCAAQGFDGGTLACAADYSYDTSGCYACGDGAAEGPEACDGADLLGQDCASQGFDGGALACAADCSYDTNGCYACGDDVVEGPEECDGANLQGNDCVSLEIGFDGGTLACDAGCGYDTNACTRCGDGVIEGTEVCDGTALGGQTCTGLGFAYGNLGCTDECGLSQIHCVNISGETEPNDDGMVAINTNDFLAANANGPYTADALIAAALNPAGDDDVFAISNPGPGYVAVALETYGAAPGVCDLPLDTQIYLLTNTGMQLAFNDDAGINNCSLLTNILIPPGITLYARIIEFGDNAVVPAYHLHIRVDPVACGDGLGGPLEQCDDGGVADGDGCSSTCQIEGLINEIEPNGTSAQADATGIVITDDVRIGGAIGALGDLDRFRIELASPQFVRFETFTTLGQCNNGFTTTLRLFDAAGAAIITDAGPLLGSGIVNCAALTFPLPAGTFYVQVEETGNNAPIPSYVLEVELLGDNGIETEPNEDQATANANLTGGVSDVYVFGDHTLNVDSDYYAIDVPVNGSSLRLEIIEGDRAVETCEGNSVDSRLTLYDPTGLQLVDDDDDGRGFCSQIDGTGVVGQDANAHNLAAGTYYVQVRASTFEQVGIDGQFVYRLVATVREP